MRSVCVHGRRTSIARRWAAVRWVIARAVFAALATMLFGTTGAFAHLDTMHGTVLAIQGGKGEVIVKHEPFAKMPAMTMTFRVENAKSLEKLRVGNQIVADVDMDTEPWTLMHVRIAGDQAPTGPSLFRTSKRLHVGDEIPPTAFVTQFGKPFTFADARGKYAVVSFIYTRCRDARMCPLISAKFSQLQNRLGADSRLFEVTLDPDYDAPPVLRRYAQAYAFRPDRVTMLTGDPNTVLDFAALFGLSAFADPQYGLIHNDALLIVDPQGKLGEMITENSWSVDEVAAILSHFQSRPTNPLALLDVELSKAAVAVCGNGVAGFSGLLDLAVVLAIVGAFGWLVVRLARGIARGST
jgi:cytochrome oxidase Cu insertion factor (SCO1/SenC/PrrC family)/Cu/Ag efflux protein CusF